MWSIEKLFNNKLENMIRKKCIYLIVLLFVFTINIYSQISNITPFIYDIKGVNAYEEVVIAFGNLGAANLSFDKGETWDDIQIEGGQNIVNMVYKNNSLVAFLEDGDVKTSVDNGKTWNFQINVSDSIIYTGMTDNFFVVRTRHNLIVLNSEYGIISQIELEFRFKVNYNSEDPINNNPPLQIEDNKIYTFLDSTVLIYDMNLKLLEEIPIKDSKFGVSKIFVSKNKIYVTSLSKLLESELLEIDEQRNIRKFLTFENNPELFSDLDASIYYLRVFDNYLYSFNALQKNKKFPYYSIYKIDNNVKAEYIGEVDCSVDKKVISTNDIGKYKDNFYFVSDKKFIVKYNSESDISKRISDYKSFITMGGYLPIRIEDDKALYRNGYDSFTLNSKTKEVLKIETDTNFKSVNILYEKYDTKTNELQILGFNPNKSNEILIFTSRNLGKTFHLEKVMSNDPLIYIQITGFEKLENGYMISSYFKPYLSQKNEIRIYDSNFNLVSSSVDSLTKNLSTGFAKDTYYRINQDTSFFKKTYVQTSKDGKKWEDLVVYGYSDRDTVWLSNDKFDTTSFPNYRFSGLVKTNDTDYLITFLYSRNDSLFTVQKIDFQSKTIDTIVHNKIDNPNSGITDAFDYFKDTMNIVLNDTLYLLGINDEVSKIEKINFPDNGVVVQRYFRRFESRSLFAYLDDKHEVRNYWFTLNRNNGINSVKEDDLLYLPYFYNSAPFPQPTSTYVSTKVYLDNNVTITKESIKIYDINGTQVEKGNNVEISNTVWPTTLTWDAVSQPPGVYFIVIDYGGNSRAIKVLKE